MKNIAILYTLLLVACQTDNVTTLAEKEYVDYEISKMAGITDVHTRFTPHIEDKDGKLITATSQLVPNTIYKLVVSGAGSVEYRVKKTEGFQVLKSPTYTSAPLLSKSNQDAKGVGDENASVFTIRTHQDLPERLYVNIVPVHSKAGKYYREYSQVFLLPAPND